MIAVTVEITRSLRWDGEICRPGATLKVDALQAQHLLDSGRAKLIHADDAVLCIAAVRKDVQAQLKRAGGPPQPAPPEGWPWQPHSSRPLP